MFFLEYGKAKIVYEEFVNTNQIRFYLIVIFNCFFIKYFFFFSLLIKHN